MVLNQQLAKEQSKDFYEWLIDLLDWFIPHTINYIEMEDKWWNKKYSFDNEYVSEFIEDDELPYTKQYHNAWSRFTKKKELIEYIKGKDYLNTKKALEILEKVTGISEVVDIQEMRLEDVCRELGRNIKIVK